MPFAFQNPSDNDSSNLSPIGDVSGNMYGETIDTSKSFLYSINIDELTGHSFNTNTNTLLNLYCPPELTFDQGRCNKPGAVTPPPIPPCTKDGLAQMCDVNCNLNAGTTPDTFPPSPICNNKKEFEEAYKIHNPSPVVRAVNLRSFVYSEDNSPILSLNPAPNVLESNSQLPYKELILQATIVPTSPGHMIPGDVSGDQSDDERDRRNFG